MGKEDSKSGPDLRTTMTNKCWIDIENGQGWFVDDYRFGLAYLKSAGTSAVPSESLICSMKAET